MTKRRIIYATSQGHEICQVAARQWAIEPYAVIMGGNVVKAFASLREAFDCARSIQIEVIRQVNEALAAKWGARS